MKRNVRRGEVSLDFVMTTAVFLGITAGLFLIVRAGMNRFVSIQNTVVGSPWL